LPGALHTTYDATHNVTILEGDTNGDKVADFGIELTGNQTLSTADFTPGSLQVPLHLIGTQGNTTTLTGGPLDDILDGRGGAYTMIGGKGNDTYIVDNPGDVVVENSTPSFTPPSGWTVKGTADFNGDGQTDVVVANGSANQIWLLNNGTVSSTVNLQWWAGWSVIGVGDFNGDGQKDVLYLSNGLTYTAGAQYVSYLNDRDSLCQWQGAGRADGVEWQQRGHRYGASLGELHPAERGGEPDPDGNGQSQRHR
jgi:Ca2+-binding RTX toxin-like protein